MVLEIGRLPTTGSAKSAAVGRAFVGRETEAGKHIWQVVLHKARDWCDRANQAGGVLLKKLSRTAMMAMAMDRSDLEEAKTGYCELGH